MQGYRTHSEIRIVRLLPPPNPWLKGNTDGVSRGNPNPSSYDFCIRNREKNLAVVKSDKIKDTTSLKVEATLMREYLAYYKDNDIQHIIVE